LRKIWLFICRATGGTRRRFKPMNISSRPFEWVVVGTAIVWLAVHAYLDSDSGTVLYLTYLFATAAASLARFGLPSATGTVPIGFMFVLAGLPELPLKETLAIGITGAGIHALVEREPRSNWLTTMFHMSVWVLGIAAADAAYRGITKAVPGFAPTGALPLAGIVLFIVTAFPQAAAKSLQEHETLRRIWKNRFLWSLPYYMAGTAVAGLLTTLPKVSLWYSAVILAPVGLLLFYAYRLQLESLARERQHAEDLAAMQLHMVEALALAVESKDVTPVSDLHRVVHFAAGLAEALGLNDEQIRALRIAAVLHDIGQVAVPDHIIMKPGRLTPDEYQRLKIHPEIGAQIIQQAGFPSLVSMIVRSHHERWDGTGYPAGLKGAEIPIEARVLAAVDMLVALSTDRHYRKAIPLDEAMEHVARESGRGLDPVVVSRLRQVYRDLDRQASSQRVLAPPQGAELASQSAPSGNLPPFLRAIAEARREEQMVLEFTQILGSSLDLDETLNELSRRLHSSMDFDTMVLFLRQGDRLEANFVEGQHFTLFHNLSLPMSVGVTGHVATTLRPVINVPPTADPIAHRNPVAAEALKSAMIIPLDGPNGLVGTLNLYSCRHLAFRHSQLSLLMSIASKLAVTVENSAKFQQAETRASVDFLTGLPNAGALFLHLQNELARCARTETSLGLLVFDLDGFKNVNDQYGHLTGNRLLQLVAQGLRENCREYDFVARMGGDEFVMVLPGVTHDAVSLRLQRLRSYVERIGIELCGANCVSVSGGAAFFPQDGRTAEELLARADKRMYGEKHDRKHARGDVPPTAREATA